MTKQIKDFNNTELISNSQLQQVTVANLKNPNIIRQLGKEGVWQVVNQQLTQPSLGARIRSGWKKLFSWPK